MACGELQQVVLAPVVTRTCFLIQGTLNENGVSFSARDVSCCGKLTIGQSVAPCPLRTASSCSRWTPVPATTITAHARMCPFLNRGPSDDRRIKCPIQQRPLRHHEELTACSGHGWLGQSLSGFRVSSLCLLCEKSHGLPSTQCAEC